MNSMFNELIQQTSNNLILATQFCFDPESTDVRNSMGIRELFFLRCDAMHAMLELYRSEISFLPAWIGHQGTSNETHMYKTMSR